jgi:hypothetical protein
MAVSYREQNFGVGPFTRNDGFDKSACGEIIGKRFTPTDLTTKTR